jgi:hypothetical protein
MDAGAELISKSLILTDLIEKVKVTPISKFR